MSQQIQPPAPGFFNIALGHNAGAQQLVNPSDPAMYGSDNIMIGCQGSITQGPSFPGMALTSGSQNILIGNYVGSNIEDGSGNVIIGTNAGTDVVSGINNTIIGTQAGNLISNGSQNIVIGYNAVSSGSLAENEIVLGTHNETLKIQGGLNYKTGGIITHNSTNPPMDLSTLTTPLAQFYLVNDFGGQITITLPNPGLNTYIYAGSIVQFRRYNGTSYSMLINVTAGTGSTDVYLYNSASTSSTPTVALTTAQFSTTFICGGNHWFQMQTI